MSLGNRYCRKLVDNVEMLRYPIKSPFAQGKAGSLHAQLVELGLCRGWKELE